MQRTDQLEVELQRDIESARMFRSVRGRRTSLDLQIRHWDSANKTASQIGSWSPHLGINITSSNSLEINHKGQGKTSP